MVIFIIIEDKVGIHHKVGGLVFKLWFFEFQRFLKVNITLIIHNTTRFYPFMTCIFQSKLN
jgi:hypothetical protein